MTTHGWPALLLVVSLAVGCEASDPAASLVDCGDAACQAEAIAAAWDADPEACWGFLQALDDELARSALVSRLATERPGALEGRCQQLPRGGARERCNRLTQRPHLRPSHGARARRSAPIQREAPGPGSAALPLPASPASVTAPQCAVFEHSECAFRAAERHIVSHGMDGLGVALGLCALSDHGPDCAEHVLELAMPPVPAADALSTVTVTQAIAAADRYRDVGGDPTVGALYADWFWSVWTATAYAEAGQLRGDLLDHLPPAALPHLRFAIAWQLLRRSGGDLGDSTQQLAALDAVLAARQALPESSGPARPATIKQTRHSWNGERPLETSVPAAFCMGSTRRATHADPATDLRLALLEAQARLPEPPPAKEFLALVGSEEAEIIRWTGARLGVMLEPDAGEPLLDIISDTETMLVKERLVPYGKKGGHVIGR
jgi:hypothetical protein